MKQDKEKYYVDCECGCSTIRITLWKDWSDDIEISLMRYKNWGSSTWRQRLSYIWRALRYGELGGDSILLSKEETKALAIQLNKFHKQMKKST
ncbi:hypothetical protein H8D04_01360 [bacterium]|nr:hypothetical protein [bacterium]